MIRVLFVCLGNICRSPMAEAVFAHKVRAAGLEKEIEVDSAGTGNWHAGEPPHQGTQGILKQYNIPYEGHARVLKRADLNAFDYILTMDTDNLHDVQALGTGSAKIEPLLRYAPHFGTDVPDPWYDGRYQAVYEMVDAATDGLLAAIRQEHHL